jgi:hypothetical protein
MRYTKSGQGFSLGMVVVAAIALLVLVLISAIVISNLSNLNAQKGSCEVNGGTCYAIEEYGGCPPGTQKLPSGVAKCITNGDVDDTQVCCIPTGATE